VKPLRPVAIQELSGLAEGRHWQLDQPLDGLESLTPVRGHVHAIHRGNVLEVEGEASTIVTLCCDRCLQHFNQPLAFQTRELLWLGEQAREQGLETSLVEEGEAVLDLDPDALTESLDPRGSFDPAHWAFEQLSLQLPPVNRCGADCPGPASWGSAGAAIDPRWAALQALQKPDALDS
jgi:uncharacterized protein